MAIDWNDRLSAPIEAVEHGVSAADQHFDSVSTGPLTFNSISYPAAQVVVEDFGRTGPTDWQHTVTANLYFEWSRALDLHEDVIHPVAAVIDESLTALGDVSCVTNYVPESINYYSGEPNNNLILAVSIRFQATTLLDPADF